MLFRLSRLSKANQNKTITPLSHYYKFVRYFTTLAFLALTVANALALATIEEVRSNNWIRGDREFSAEYVYESREVIIRTKGVPAALISSEVLEIDSNADLVRNGSVRNVTNPTLRVALVRPTRDGQMQRFQLASYFLDRAVVTIVIESAVQTSPDIYRLHLGDMLAAAAERGPKISFVWPGDRMRLEQAIVLVNEHTDLQLNWERAEAVNNETIVITNRSLRQFGSNNLRNWMSELTNYVLIEHSENVFSLVAKQLLVKTNGPSLSFVVADFSVTNAPLFEVMTLLTNRAPFEFEFWKPLGIRVEAGKGIKSLEAHWSAVDLSHSVSLAPRTRSLRQILLESFTPHFKCYWEAFPPPPQAPVTNALSIRVFRPSDRQSPIYNGEID
jgi:hypothetical protein